MNFGVESSLSGVFKPDLEIHIGWLGFPRDKEAFGIVGLLCNGLGVVEEI